MTVQIETNGTFYEEVFPYSRVQIVCSPKTPKINDKLAAHVDAFKYIIDADHVDDEDGLPTAVLGMEVKPARPWDYMALEQCDVQKVYVQPLDTGSPKENERHLQAAVDVSMKHGYRLSIQSHKLAGLK